MKPVRCFVSFCFAVTTLLIWCSAQAQDGNVVEKPGTIRTSEWESLRRTGEDSLNQAAACFPDSDCQYTVLINKAASAYLKMSGMLTGEQRTASNVVTVAEGLSRSGRVIDAIQLLHRQDELRTDGNLQHLLADSLFSIGDYRNAALAYRTWIDEGCKGYFSSPRETGLWIVKIGAPRCSTLPADLRARLENLRDVAGGEPSNLPPNNSPTARFTER